MEQIRIDLVPGGVTPNAHASQYDVGRGIRFLLYNGGSAYTLAGTETITVDVTKPDGTTDTVSVTNTSSNYVDFVTTDGLLNQAGLYPCEISIVDGGTEIGSQNFNLRAEADAYDGADIVTVTVGPADICTFTTTLAEPLQSVTVDITATGGNGTPDNPNPIVGYSEANITRCGVNLFDDDNLVIANYPYSSMTFDKATYLKAGTYTASISNVENASSWRFGYRFFNADGTIITSAITNGLVSFTAGTAFLDAYDSNQTCLQASDNTETSVKFTLTKDTYIVGCISNGNVGASTTLDYQIETGSTATNFTPYNGQTYTIAFGQTVYGGVLDVTRRKLHVTWGGDNLGSLTWTHRTDIATGVFASPLPDYKFATNVQASCSCYPFDGTATAGTIVSHGDNVILLYYDTGSSSRYVYVYDTDYSDANAFKTAMNGQMFIYELATPFDIDLTPEVISAIVGENNVFADCGSSTVKYLEAGA